MTPVMKVRELIPTYAKIEAGDIRPERSGRVRIRSAADVAQLMRPIFGQQIDESVWAVYLNASNALVSVYRISEGSTSESGLYPAKVFRGAILSNASAVIVVHNHPSNECHPSACDRTGTEELIKGGEYLRIPVLDHVIVGETTQYSFAEAGLIDEYRRSAK